MNAFGSLIRISFSVYNECNYYNYSFILMLWILSRNWQSFTNQLLDTMIWEFVSLSFIILIFLAACTSFWSLTEEILPSRLFFSYSLSFLLKLINCFVTFICKGRINKLWKEPNEILMNLTDSSVDCSQTCFCFILVTRFLSVSQ